MKKILLITALASMLSADTYLKFVGGSSSANFTDKVTNQNYYDNGQNFQVGFGVDTKGRDIYWGINFLFGYDDMPSDYILSYTGDFDLGFTINRRLAIYAIGSALQQDYHKDVKGGYGFGFGGGMNYRFTDKISGVMEYKSYDVTSKYFATPDYRYETLSAGINIGF